MAVDCVDAALHGYQRVKHGDEKDLQSAVAMEGPISIAVDAQHNTFRVRVLGATRLGQ